MELKTKRLTLRELAEDDFASIANYELRPEVKQQMLWFQRSERQIKQHLTAVIQHQNTDPRMCYAFAITMQTTLAAPTELIGYCNLILQPEKTKTSFITENVLEPIALYRLAVAAIAKGNYGVNIGWTFEPQYWGRGYATEAGQALVALAFTIKPQPAKWAIGECYLDNLASRRVMEKLGMKLITPYWWVGLNWTSWTLLRRRAVRYSITRSDWLQQKAHSEV